MDKSATSKPIILINTHVYPRTNNDHVAPFMHDFAKVVSKFARVVVLCPHAPNLPTQEIIDGIEIRRFRYAKEAKQTLAYQGDMHKQVKRSPFKALLFFTFLRKWRRATKQIIEELNPDIIHTHWLIPGGYVTGKAIGKNNRSKLMISMHGTDVFLVKKLRLAKQLAKRSLNQATNHHYVSNALSDIIQQNYSLTDKTNLILPMVFGLNRFERRHQKTGNKRILFVGRLMQVKGIDILIRAFSKLISHPDFVDWQLDIVGDGPEYDNLVKLAVENSSERSIIFHGYKNRDQIVGYYDNADLLVLPSKTTSLGEKEGLGLVVLEAMMSGVAVIGTTCGGIKETIEHEVTGLIVNENDSEALYEAIRRMLSDAEFRQKMADQAYQMVQEKYSQVSLIATMKQFYGVD